MSATDGSSSLAQPDGSPVPAMSVDELLAEARSGLVRVEPAEAAALMDGGGVVVDLRPVADRRREGQIRGAWVIERNVVEWRLDPRCSARHEGVDDSFYDRPVILFCNDGYASSLAAASLQKLGISRATDLIGGYRAWAARGLATVPADLD